MNALDVALVALLVAGAASGWRLGRLGRASTWVGLGLGLLAAGRAGPYLAARASPGDVRVALVVSGVVLVAGAAAGQLAGMASAHCLRAQRGLPAQPGRLDRLAGAVVGAVGVLGLVWVLVPAVGRTRLLPPGVLASSPVVRVVGRLPTAPDPFGGALRGHPAGDLLATVHEQVDQVGPPPRTGLPRAVRQRVAPSVVRVEAFGDSPRSGSGVVVAGRVVTAAHVVAGAERVQVHLEGLDDGGTGGRQAVVSSLDERRDLALLDLPGVDLADRSLPVVGTEGPADGSVLGRPRLRGIAQRPARLDAAFTAGPEGRGYRLRFVATDVGPGFSGAPMVDVDGRVRGVLVATARPGVAVAVSGAEVADALADAVDDGPRRPRRDLDAVGPAGG